MFPSGATSLSTCGHGSVDNNAYEIEANPEAVDDDMWDCCFIQFFLMAKLSVRNV